MQARMYAVKVSILSAELGVSRGARRLKSSWPDVWADIIILPRQHFSKTLGLGPHLHRSLQFQEQHIIRSDFDTDVDRPFHICANAVPSLQQENADHVEAMKVPDIVTNATRLSAPP